MVVSPYLWEVPRPLADASTPDGIHFYIYIKFFFAQNLQYQLKNCKTKMLRQSEYHYFPISIIFHRIVSWIFLLNKSRGSLTHDHIDNVTYPFYQISRLFTIDTTHVKQDTKVELVCWRRLKIKINLKHNCDSSSISKGFSLEAMLLLILAWMPAEAECILVISVVTEPRSFCTPLSLSATPSSHAWSLCLRSVLILMKGRGSIANPA